MESDKFMRFWFRITELYGLQPKKTNKCHNAIAYIWFYSFITIYTTLMMKLFPSVTTVQEFVEIFIYLPAFWLVAIKFTKFLSASDKIGKLLEIMNDISNELGINAGMKFKSFPLLFKINVVQVATFPFTYVIESVKSAINRKILMKLWMPEKGENDEMFFWIYFAFEKSSMFVLIISFTFNIVTFAIIINLTRLAKAYGAKLRSLNLLQTEKWKENLSNVVRINEKLKRFDSETCALNNSLIYFVIHSACVLFEEIFSIMLLFQQVLGVVLICVIMFSLLYFEKFEQFLLIYGTSILLQIFLFCFFITQLEAACASFVQDLYQCDWSDGVNEDKKDLLTLMTFQQKPITIQVIGLFRMNLTMFLKVSLTRS